MTDKYDWMELSDYVVRSDSELRRSRVDAIFKNGDKLTNIAGDAVNWRNVAKYRLHQDSPASRDEALQWLVDNVDEWPTNLDFPKPPMISCKWRKSEDPGFYLYVECGVDERPYITRDDWLAAQSKSDDAEDAERLDDAISERCGPEAFHKNQQSKKNAAVLTLQSMGYVYIGGEKWITEAPKEWDGKGFPSVGTKCEFAWGDDYWEIGLIEYISKRTVVITLTDGSEASYTSSKEKFRPIKSEDDQRRDATIAELEIIVSKAATFKESLAAIYDAGWRKLDKL